MPDQDYPILGYLLGSAGKSHFDATGQDRRASCCDSADDTIWPADYEGDLYITQDGKPVALGPRADAAVSFDAGLVTESHMRPLAEPVAASAPVVIQVYDPFYYVAYTIRDVVLQGDNACRAELEPADLEAANRMMQELWGRPASDYSADEQMPEVGMAFADSVVVTCDG